MKKEYFCPSCGSSRVMNWSGFQRNFNENPINAVSSSIFHIAKHIVLGELSISKNTVFEERSKNIKKCDNCSTCFLICPHCDHLNKVDLSKLVLDQSTVVCGKCRKIILYAGPDYTVEGG